MYCVHVWYDSFLVNLLNRNLTPKRSDALIVNACDVEYLMFYTPPKFLSECILNQNVNSVDPHQIWIQQKPAEFCLSIQKRKKYG